MSLIALVILLVDQVTKQLVLRVLPLPVWLISDEVGLRLSYNTGIAFSLPVTGALAMLLPFSLATALLFYYWRYTNRSGWTDLVFGLILGGAIGNILDRLFYGAVIDYISIYFYPTFNIADVAITLGFLLFILRFDTITSKRFSLF